MTFSTTPYSRKARGLVFALALLGAVAVIGFSPAEAQAQTVNVRAQTILASNNGSGVDGSLSSIAGQLRSRFGQYSSFRQLQDNRIAMSEGQTRSISLPNGQTMTISFLGMSGSSYRLNVSMPGGGSTVTVGPGGIFFVAGPQHQGGLLVIAIRV